MKAWKAELFLFLVTFIWGGTFVFTKIGLNFTNPSFYILMRFGIALLLTLIIFGKHLKNIDKTTFKHGIILGLFFGGGFLLQTYGLLLTTVSKSAFITGITVPFTPFVYYLVERKPIQIWSKIGVVIAFIGLAFFTAPDLMKEELTVNMGDVLTLISTLFWALYITYMDVFTRGKSGIKLNAQLLTLQFIASASIALIAFFGFDLNNFKFIWDNQLLISLGFNAILASFMVTLIHTSIQRYTTPVKAALIFSLEPIIASAVAWLMFSETLQNLELIGALILLSGVLVSEFGGMLNKSSKTV